MTAQTLIGKKPIRRALISVYDKSGLISLAQGLHELGVDIVSTGSTAKTIADKGIPVTPVEFVTGFPEILDGRVKTLHPHVHAGLLADTRNPEHLAALEKLRASGVVIKNWAPGLLLAFRQNTDIVLKDRADHDPEFAAAWANQKSFVAQGATWRTLSRLP